jgi:MFS family permease
VLSVLRRRDFALLWFGGLVSVAGDWVLAAALPFFVYQRTGSTVATAGMIVAELAPSMVLGTFAGVFADRWDRKRILVVANLLQAVAVAVLLLVQDDSWLWLVYAVAVAQSAVASFATPAEGALLPSLVPDGDLVPANALNALNNRLGRLLGAPLGGALLGIAGLEGVVLVDCATFVAAAALIAPISPPRRLPQASADATAAARSASARFWADWAAGMRLVRGDRTITLLLVVFAFMTFGGTMLDPLTPAWVYDLLDEGPETFAALMTAHAVTGILGTLVVGRFGAHATPRALIGWTSLTAGLAHVVQYTLPSVPLAFSVALVTGFTSVLASVGVETLAQRAVADEFRGRVFGALGATLGFVSLSGALVGGAVGDAVGVRPALYLPAALIAFSGVIVLRAFAPGGAAAVAPGATGPG